MYTYKVVGTKPRPGSGAIKLNDLEIYELTRDGKVIAVIEEKPTHGFETYVTYKETDYYSIGHLLSVLNEKDIEVNTVETDSSEEITHMKTPHIRLMDLTAGWSEFVGEEETMDYHEPDIAQATFNLYQEVGCKDNMTPDEVRQFIIDKVIPLVLGE